MKKFGICAVLLSMVLFVGCKDKVKKETPTTDGKAPVEAPEKADEKATDAKPVTDAKPAAKPAAGTAVEDDE